MADKLFALGQLLKVVHGGKRILKCSLKSRLPQDWRSWLVGSLSQSVWSSGLKEVSS